MDNQKSFPEVNLDPGFRIMDEGEKKLIENDVLEDVLEEFYAEADEEFFNLVDAFGMGRDDSGLVSIIDKIYRFQEAIRGLMSGLTSVC